MDITFIDNKDQWNDYIQRHAGNDGGFLQSWEWGEFQKSYGRKVMRMAILEKNEIVFGWQMIEMPLPLGLKYWYVPRPVGNYELRTCLAGRQVTNYGLFIQEIKKVALKSKAVFIRVDGAGDDVEKFGCKKVDISIQPKEEFIIDITKPQEQLLAEMKPKTRYNIRVAEKHGVIVETPSPQTLSHQGRGSVSGDFSPPRWGRMSRAQAEGQERGIIDEFYNLIQKTSERQGIHPHPKEYYQKMLEELGKNGLATLYTAQYQGKAVAANLITYFGKTATYLHGGTDDEFKNVMAPYLLQWQAMCDAKKKGFELYNFGGVSKVKKSWEGITRFKTGFSSDTQFTQYGGVWDLPVNGIKYGVYRLAKRFV